MVEEQATQTAPKASGPIQFTTLNRWRRERAMLEVFLVNGQRLVGRVRSFDRFSMLLEMPQGGCFVFHHTVSTLQPASKGSRRPGPGPGAGSASSGRPPRRERSESGADGPGRSEPVEANRSRAPGAAPEVKVMRRPRRTIQRDPD